MEQITWWYALHCNSDYYNSLNLFFNNKLSEGIDSCERDTYEDAYPMLPEKWLYSNIFLSE